MLTLLLLACAGSPSMDGRVLDVWGKPLTGASVVIEGVVQRYATDGGGVFHIETDATVKRLMAGKTGYIKAVAEVPAPADEGDDYQPVTFTLYPEPEKPGFYAVGPKAYVLVEPQRIVMVGTELRHFSGMRDIPATGLHAGPGRFVFTSRLRSSDLSRMNLHLSKLDFVAHTPVKGLLGPVEATVNLWAAAGEVPFDLEQLPSRDDYLVRTRAPLTSGMYAFHAQNVLDETDERVFLMMPKEMQVAFPFEVN